MKKFYLFFFLSFYIFSKDIIVTIHSYSNDLVWTNEQNEFFKKNLGSNYDYTDFFMNTKRLKESEFKSVANSILLEIKKLKPKLVYITDDNALKYVGKYIDPSIPMIYSGINDSIRSEYPWLLERKNCFGLSERPLIFRTVSTIIEKLDFKNSNVLILLGDDSTGQGIFEFDLGGRETISISNKEKIKVIKTSAFEDWKKYILASEDQTFSFILPLSNYSLYDKNGKIMSFTEVMNWINKNSPLPIFTVHADQISPTMAIGGVVLRGRYFGEEAGKMAKEFLSGNSNNLKSKTLDTGDITFSRGSLEKWNLTIRTDSSNIKFIE